MSINYYDINDNLKIKAVIIYAKYNNKIIMCKHKDRGTWELPGGHVEDGETIEQAAKRELHEETGAIEFDLVLKFKYSYKVNDKECFYAFFEASIFKLDELPNYEIKEVDYFDNIPENNTYPEIYKEIINRK